MSNKVYHIYEYKKVVYTYKVYAKSKADAVNKFKNHEGYEEIGMDQAGTFRNDSIEEVGVATESCAVCGEEFNPENVRDYRCNRC